MTFLLIFLNVALFLITSLLGRDFLGGNPQVLLALGANFGPLTLNGEAWRLVSAMFLHWGVLHLAMNMLGLWDGGRLMEAALGRGRFLLLYFGAGVAASLTSVLWHANTLSVGASGAVFGVYGALFTLAFLARQRHPMARQISSNMWAFLGYNLVFGFVIPQIDMAAHIGGLVAGVLLGLLLRKR